MGLAWYNGFSPQERMKGGKIINEAIKKGELKDLRLMKCERCGQDKGVRVYHCEDYSPENILNDVVCLCYKCHMQIHTNKAYRNTKRYKKYEKDINNGLIYPPVYTKWWSEEYENEIYK